MKLDYKLLITGWVLMLACTSSRITSTWKAENVQPLNYKTILVLGLINDPDKSIRADIEAKVVANLKELGYSAICSCDEFGPESFEGMTEQEVLSKLSNSAIDAVLTIVLLDKTKERYYVPSRVSYPSYAVAQGRFWGYYTSMVEKVYSLDYYVINTRYFWESNFYSLKNESQLLYSANSQSFDPKSTSRLTSEYGKMIVKDMLKAKVITDKPKEKVLLGF
jgi:hypothetical protein